jgi:hypothetical protein
VIRRGLGGGGRVARWSAVLAVLLLVGCRDMDGRVPVTGRVTVDGQPVEGLRLEFVPSPDGKGNGGFAVSQSDGAFAVTTHQFRPGIFPGDYTITASWKLEPTIPEPGPDAPMDDVVAWNRARVNAPEKLPARYQNLAATPIKAVVDGTQGPLSIEIESAARPATR